MTEPQHHTLNADPVVFNMRDPGMQAPVPHGFSANEMAAGVIHEPGTGSGSIIVTEFYGEADSASSTVSGAGGSGEIIDAPITEPDEENGCPNDDDDELEDALAEDDDIADEAGGGALTEESAPASAPGSDAPAATEGTEPVSGTE